MFNKGVDQMGLNVLCLKNNVEFFTVQMSTFCLNYPFSNYGSTLTRPLTNPPTIPQFRKYLKH